ncbi:hypothetical protein [Polynucleobacter sp. es-EL-1]|uniref:hypothetical protein n=1 Tax=Polynucleobacter sp. es-EL-1 TaxID=1855652 RepID=UPI001BFDD36A|nr:hypothetical protein [Polynucleobacter sp. es-EL-1]QWE09847.1 hypothetical protein FD974_05690 [Polynucleobacter sp. es-EL-1]
MVKLLGLFVMFISAYCLEQGSLDLGLVQAFFIGLLMFFSEALISHVSFVQREKVRAKYRGR